MLKKVWWPVTLFFCFHLFIFGVGDTISVMAAQKDGAKKAVLVLHSYHRGLSWTDSITDGIEKRFAEEDLAVDISYEFMDTKRFFSDLHYTNLEQLYRHKYGTSNFDVIISSDDNAYQFLLNNGKALFPGTPVVFCGVNNFKNEQISDKPWITGVQEDFDFESTIRVALQMKEGLNTVLIIGDQTTSGKANMERLQSIMPQLGDGIFFDILENHTMVEVQERVAALGADAIAVWLHFTADRDGTFYSFEESAEQIARVSTVPLYSTWDFMLGHGIAGGMITSGVSQGYTAATLAVRVLAGEDPAEIDIVAESPNKLIFDHVQLERYGIDSGRLPEGAQIINKPATLLDQNREFVLSIIGGFFILSVVILLLSASNVRRLRAEKRALQAKNRYLSIFSDTNVAILVEDYSDLVEDFIRIEIESEGHVDEYFAFHPAVARELGRKIRVVDANPAALLLYGLENRDELGDLLQRVTVAEQSNYLPAFFTSLISREKSFSVETINRTLGGQLRNVIVNVQIPRDYDDFNSVLVSVVDITERKQAENALQQSETRFRTAFNSAATGMALIDLDGKYLMVNRIFCKKLGYSESELLQMSWRDVTHPEDIEGSQKRLDRLLTGETVEPEEKRYNSKSGEILWALMSGAVITDTQGKPVCYISQFQDISPRKLVEEKLMMQKERYRKYFEEDLSGVFVMNHTGRLVACNQAFRDIFGVDDEKNINTINFFSFFSNETDGQQFFNTLIVKKRLEYYNLRLLRQDGTHLEIVINAIGRFNKSGKLREVQGYLMDVTRQKALETQLLQAQKLESIGTMAGGLAHDFNNLLMGVLGNTSLLMMEKEEGDPDLPRLQNIEEYVKSGSSLTKQLLGFAKGGKYEVKPYDLNEIIRYNSAMFRQTHKEVALELAFDITEAIADVDRSQIDQVMYNLYVNAWQAMQDGGNIKVRTSITTLGEEFTSMHGVEAGTYVKIEVEDDGQGMDKDTLQRIFDPFFTTKEMSRGVGLGLASCYGIIQNHNGIIVADSTPEVGSCFTIYLPSSGETSVIDGQAPIKGAIKQGQETILLVDDEEMILGVGIQMLGALGYTVLQANSGRDAVEIFSEKHTDIDLIILDMIMPGMSGGETFDALLDIDGSVKVLLSSGYSLDNKSNAILQRGCLGFLQKPFDLMTLSEKIRQVLDSSRQE